MCWCFSESTFITFLFSVPTHLFSTTCSIDDSNYYLQTGLLSCIPIAQSNCVLLVTIWMFILQATWRSASASFSRLFTSFGPFISPWFLHALCYFGLPCLCTPRSPVECFLPYVSLGLSGRSPKQNRLVPALSQYSRNLTLVPCHDYCRHLHVIL